MHKAAMIFLSTALLTSCSIYSSAGRKQFEGAVSPQVQAYSLVGCRDLSAAEAWIKDEFPSSNSELVELHPEYEVWRKPQGTAPVEVTVLAKHDETTQSCLYHFESEALWQRTQKKFLKELSNSLADSE